MFLPVDVYYIRVDNSLLPKVSGNIAANIYEKLNCRMVYHLHRQVVGYICPSMRVIRPGSRNAHPTSRSPFLFFSLLVSPSSDFFFFLLLVRCPLDVRATFQTILVSSLPQVICAGRSAPLRLLSSKYARPISSVCTLSPPFCPTLSCQARRRTIVCGRRASVPVIRGIGGAWSGKPVVVCDGQTHSGSTSCIRMVVSRLPRLPSTAPFTTGRKYISIVYG